MVSDFRPQESYEFFLQEAPELLRELEDGILTLRQNWNVSQVWELMRVAHSLKGGAACAGLNHVQDLAHRLENTFKVIAESEVEISLETEDLLLKGFDTLKWPISEEIQHGTCDYATILRQAEAVWVSLEENLQRYPKPGTRNGADFEDVVHLLFAEDVGKGLKRLATVLSQNSLPEMVDAFTIQAQIFKGIGDISQLPGFVAIANATIKALTHNPKLVLRIGQQALEDFRMAQELVLAGDRQQGGNPSPALLALTEPIPLDKLEMELQTISVEARRVEVTAEHPPLKSTPPPVSLPSPSTSGSPPTPPITAPVLMSARQDWERLETLNGLVGELISLDNRFLAQNQNHEETLEVFLNSFTRIKQQVLNLYRWSNQFSGLALPQASPVSYPVAYPSAGRGMPPQIGHLRTTLEGVLEELTQLNETFRDLSLLGQQYQNILKQKQKTIKTVKSNLLQSQMIPIGELLHQFPRVIRDLSMQENKKINLDLQGDNTLIEKAVLEKLYDPLVHLVRNAFDHGIETPQVRKALNKSDIATIRIKAWHQGHHTYISIEDDGQGIDPEQIQAKALALGWLQPDSANVLGEQQLYQYIFEPNFSTAASISQLSGRGMGLYAVQSQISALKGTVSVQSQLGKGTQFLLRLPLTSTITRLVVFRISRHLFALPINTLAAITIAQESSIQVHQNQIFYPWKGQFVPILTLSSLVTYHYPLPSLSQSELGQVAFNDLPDDRDGNPASSFSLLLISRGAQMVALRVDEILVERDLVIKPFNNLSLNPPSNLIGCCILGDGCLVPVLDGLAIVEQWGHSTSHIILGSRVPTDISIPTRSTILVVDDSLTIRNAVSSTLVKAGYRVLQAKDGWEAFNLWKQESQIAGIVCDIEMPRMTGLEFLSRCRQQDQHLPIIMLTYRSSQRYRQLAEQLGASAYLTKPYLDKELLSTLEDCLNRVQSS